MTTEAYAFLILALFLYIDGALMMYAIVGKANRRALSAAQIAFVATLWPVFGIAFIVLAPPRE
jgi:hypothetical protein